MRVLPVLAAIFMLLAATGAEAVDSMALDETGDAPGGPLSDGSPPNTFPSLSYQSTPMTAPAYSTDSFDLAPGMAGTPTYDPAGPLPAPITQSSGN